jgi:ABC-type nitrate/sulfonate/bicarbonate transport system permease component
MSEQNNPHGPPRDDGSQFHPLWLIVAFAPVTLWMLAVDRGRETPGLVEPAFALMPVISLIAALGLLRGIKDTSRRIVLGLFLGGAIFVVNFLIGVVIGCSRSHL